MSKKLTLSRRDFVLTGAAVTAGLGLTSSRVRAQGLTPVSFRLNYVANAEHAPYFLAVQKGYYKDVGLDVKITPGNGSNDTVKLVGAGNEMFGVAVSDAVATGRGRGVPVVSLAVLLQQSPNVLMSLESTGIQAPTDLYGKHVGVDTRSTDYAFWKALVKSTNLDPSKIQVTDLGDGSATALLLSKAIDATMGLATNEVVAVESEGTKLNVMEPGKYGVQAYGQVLFGNEQIVTKNPDLAVRFRSATLKAWEYTIDHVDEAIAALKEAVPATDIASETAKWKEIIPRTKPVDGSSIPFGTQTVAGWQKTIDTFKAADLIDQDFKPDEIIAKTAG